MVTATEIAQLAALSVKLRATSKAASDWRPYPHQVAPDWDWDTWLIQGGRGSGKTEGGTRYVLAFLESETGRNSRVGVGAPTIAAARDVCAEGETGLITLDPGAFRYNRSLGEAYHRNGGYVKFLGSEEPARWNGPQWHLLWADELALWNEESWHQAQFGVRLGSWPRVIATTTPKARKFVRLLKANTRTAVTHGTMYDNTALADRVKQRLEERYGGTRLGRQEIYGEDIEDIEGALWQAEWIDSNRVTKEHADSVGMVRVVVPVDPAVTHKLTSDDTGIAVVGLGKDGHYYIFSVAGYKLSPDGWARQAVNAYDQWEADRIIGEVNNGGEMVESTIRSVSDTVPFKSIHASRGKVLRAEPVAALYEQGKVHHVGIFEAAEEQMCAFPVSNEHDDLVDAITYGVTELMGGEANVRFL